MIDEKKLFELIKEYSYPITQFNNSVDIGMTLEGIKQAIDEQPKIGEWIPCSERMPEEHDSIFAKFKGTEKWHNGMFEKTSDEVNATVEFDDGVRKVKTLHTIDGKWNEGDRGLKFTVIAWQPLPEAYHG